MVSKTPAWFPSLAVSPAPTIGLILGVTLLAHFVLWSVGPSLVVGNLHSDTLEALYWGTDFAFGYDKHPPLLSWLLIAMLRLSQSLGINPILGELLFSQTLVAVAAWHVWRAAKIYVSDAAAFGTAVMVMVSPVATVFAVQINHNSALMMFWAVAQYYALVYLERRRVSDAVLLGLATGLGFLIKYELLFLVLPLAVGTVLVPRWRSVWWQWPSLLAATMAVLLVAPHFDWLAQHHWPSVQRAMGVQKIDSLARVLTTVQNLIVGQLTLLGLPALMFLTSHGWGVWRQTGRSRSHEQMVLGLLLVAGPGIVLILGDLITFQVAKPLWALSLMPSSALGLALLAPPLPCLVTTAGDQTSTFNLRPVWQALAWSAGVLALWLGYLVVSNLVHEPLVFYAPNTAQMSAAVQEYWSGFQPGAPGCVVINEKRIGAAYVLWAQRPPEVVDVSTVSWNGPERVASCNALGGVVIEADATSGRVPTTPRLPRMCLATAKRITIPGAYGPARPSFTVTLYYLPPNGAPLAAQCPAS